MRDLNDNLLSPLMAPSGLLDAIDQCPLCGVKQTSLERERMPNWCEEETGDENENASTDGYLQGLAASGLQHAHELEETSVAVGRAGPPLAGLLARDHSGRAISW